MSLNIWHRFTCDVTPHFICDPADWFCPYLLPSVRLTPFSHCWFHLIIMTFSGIINIDRSDVHTKYEVTGPGHFFHSFILILRLGCCLCPNHWGWQQSKQMLPQFGHFRTVTLVFINVIHQISRSRRKKNQFNGYEMMHKTWCSNQMPYCFSRPSYPSFCSRVELKTYLSLLLWTITSSFIFGRLFLS